MGDLEALERLQILEDRLAKRELVEGIDSQWPFEKFASKRNGHEHETLMRVGRKLGFVKALLDQGPASASFDAVTRTVDELLEIVSTRARIVLTADEDGSWETAAHIRGPGQASAPYLERTKGQVESALKETEAARKKKAAKEKLAKRSVVSAAPKGVGHQAVSSDLRVPPGMMLVPVSAMAPHQSGLGTAIGPGSSTSQPRAYGVGGPVWSGGGKRPLAGSAVQCYICKGSLHVATNCPNRGNAPRPGIQCHACGGSGHIRDVCVSPGGGAAAAGGAAAGPRA